MTELKRIKNKHLTIEDRNKIQDFLDHGMPFKEIARRIGKDQTTVSKEVKKHITAVACGY
jgi:transposase, IS30 family